MYVMQSMSKQAARGAFELPTKQIGRCASFFEDIFDYFNSPSTKFLVHSVGIFFHNVLLITRTAEILDKGRLLEFFGKRFVQIKSSLYQPYYAEATSGEAGLRGLVPGQHSCEETSLRWRAVNDTVFNLTGQGCGIRNLRRREQCFYHYATLICASELCNIYVFA